jgi:hypothetical protein
MIWCYFSAFSLVSTLGKVVNSLWSEERRGAWVPPLLSILETMGHGGGQGEPLSRVKYTQYSKYTKANLRVWLLYFGLKSLKSIKRNVVNPRKRDVHRAKTNQHHSSNTCIRKFGLEKVQSQICGKIS